MDEKKNATNVATQIRLAEYLYNYAKSEAERLGVSMNSALNSILDDGRRFREATILLQAKDQ